MSQCYFFFGEFEKLGLKNQVLDSRAWIEEMKATELLIVQWRVRMAKIDFSYVAMIERIILVQKLGESSRRFLGGMMPLTRQSMGS
jgi:hypothetical protein